MNLTSFFKSYELLADRADKAFQSVMTAHRGCVKCELHCADCCHAVFGLFAIEAAYIQQHFSDLDSDLKARVLQRGKNADRQLKRLETKLAQHRDDPRMHTLIMARERIRCPLLDGSQTCVLYPYRPITCRVYGIPTAMGGKTRVCGRTGFEPGKTYPIFDLDKVYRDLFALSQGLLEQMGDPDPERAALLVSVAKAVSTPLQALLGQTP
jgi:Fe-S-cluster containining protein